MAGPHGSTRNEESDGREGGNEFHEEVEDGNRKERTHGVHRGVRPQWLVEVGGVGDEKHCEDGELQSLDGRDRAEHDAHGRVCDEERGRNEDEKRPEPKAPKATSQTDATKEPCGSYAVEKIATPTIVQRRRQSFQVVGQKQMDVVEGIALQLPPAGVTNVGGRVRVVSRFEPVVQDADVHLATRKVVEVGQVTGTVVEELMTVGEHDAPIKAKQTF